MTIEKMPLEFKQAIPIIKKIEQAGFEAYFVGGSVRDIFLNHPIHDVDIATSAFPEEVKQIFKKTVDVGIEHGTVLVLFEHEQYEVTTFRTESTYQDYRRPDEVTFVRSLEEDLKRRDFTMNALAMDLDGKIIDLFNGIEAINKKEIVAVGNPSERFNEDALRMMRGLRFSSQLNFTIEENTKEAIREHHALLDKISVERINIEWIKLLLGNYRNKGLLTFIETGCYQYCPGLKNKQKELMNLLLLDESLVIKSEEIAWLLLCYVLDIENTNQFLRDWKCSNKILQNINQGMKQLKKRKLEEWSNDDLYRSGEEVVILVEEVRTILGEESTLEQVMVSYEKLPIKSMKELEVNGKELLTYLDAQPGPWLGEILGTLEEKVLNGELPNNKEKLLERAKILRK
ncbi:CCA tRNA nucleotidyltransferase [Vagococcus carniphilus]|uniref:CCA tRNA nucleotidyltransferase n=1 Tax=Vagococcus carniphilus TaxID=218144 RepID=UPI00288FF987|nr:CCA tRNA nucleotidyltransferase [Vagococcus carniphilus]MDT2815829.1 CCA tRNA nucleotidyltransferase [Vagococcus carniphilus]